VVPGVLEVDVIIATAMRSGLSTVMISRYACPRVPTRFSLGTTMSAKLISTLSQ
jgi:hypothetical protein